MNPVCVEEVQYILCCCTFINESEKGTSEPGGGYLGLVDRVKGRFSISFQM
jgi:hypothetical protein